MLKKILITLLVIVIVIVIVGLFRGLSGEDNWICSDGQWVKHGNPSAPMPTTGCGTTATELYQTTSPNLKLANLKPGSTISSPFEITGQAKTWYFEASFPVKVMDINNKEIGSGIATAQSDWMTEDFVAFKAPIEFTVTSTMPGTIVLMKDNPSGLPANDESVKIPVLLQASETTTVKVFFNNNKLDPEISCNKVFSVDRKVAKTVAVGTAAINELLKGPTEVEKADGYTTSLNDNVKLEKLTITDGVATAEFDEQLDKNMGGSCRVLAIRAQIEQTLKQFPTVKSVVISINGRTEDILQP